MVEYRTSSDIGAVLIGNEDWTFAVPNGIGDGENIVRVYSSDAEFMNDPWSKGMKFISSAQGTFGIFGYDCDYHELLRHEMSIKDAVCVLKGRYGVYYKPNSYRVAFVKWID